MKSDVIHVASDGSGIDQALLQTELVAAYKSLSHKNALHLRLLTEEMMGMLRGLTGEREADFWIDDEDASFRLHLRAQTKMNAQMREKLLSASTTGENAAVKGIMGKIRDLFDRLTEPIDGCLSSAIEIGLTYNSAVMGSPSLMSTGIWSLNQYKNRVMEAPTQAESWDELEKSVVARLADEVQISIAERNVEMIIFKKFE